MNDKSIYRNDIGLIDLLEILRKGWRYWLVGGVLGVAAASAAIFLLPSQFEAVAIVQVGRVGQLSQIGQVESVPIELPALAVERIRSPSFQQAVAQQVGDIAWLEALSESPTLAVRMSAQAQTTTPFIELRVVAKSRDQAKAIAEAAIKELATRHAELAKPYIEKLGPVLAIKREKLSRLEQDIKSLQNLSVNANIRDDRFTQLSLIAALKAQKESQVFDIRQSIFDYERALMPPATQTAKALEELYVGKKPVAPNKALLLTLGILGGLLAGVVALFARDARSNLIGVDAAA